MVSFRLKTKKVEFWFHQSYSYSMEFLRRVREVLRLPQSKMLFEIPEQVEKDGAYWFEESRRKSEADDGNNLKCPWKGCNGDMLEGPSGGMSTNVKCDTCERRWNITPIIGQMERI